VTCKKTQGFLETTGGAVTTTVAAVKTKYGPREALELLKDAHRFIAIKGKKVVIFDLKNERPDDETLLGHLLGPTGNLRAPTARIGRTLVVGFNEEAYRQVLEA
jgi:arsenate reductase-like glutaredoxin family protein